MCIWWNSNLFRAQKLIDRSKIAFLGNSFFYSFWGFCKWLFLTYLMDFGSSIGKNLTRNTSIIFLCQTKPNLMFKGGKTTVSSDKKWHKTFICNVLGFYTPTQYHYGHWDNIQLTIPRGILEILILAHDRCVLHAVCTICSLQTNCIKYHAPCSMQTNSIEYPKPFSSNFAYCMHYAPIWCQSDVISPNLHYAPCIKYPNHFFLNHCLLHAVYTKNRHFSLKFCLLHAVRTMQ